MLTVTPRDKHSKKIRGDLQDQCDCGIKRGYEQSALMKTKVRRFIRRTRLMRAEQVEGGLEHIREIK